MSGTDGGGDVDDPMEQRATGGRLMVWFLIDGNRWVVTGLLLALAYVLLVLIAQVAPGSPQKLLEMDPILALFTPIVIGIIMGVSLVLTFNQLVLGRELGPIRQHREDMRESMSFRRDVESIVEGGVSPPEPSAFLRGLVVATRDRADALLETVADDANADLREDVEDYATAVIDDAEQVSRQLEGGEFGEFDVVQAALRYNYSWKIYAARRLQSRYRDALSDEARTALDDLIELLEFFGPTREHFKTLYFRWDIINVSRALIYTALPALVVAAYVLLVFEPADVPGTVLGVDASLLAVGVGFVVGITPFTIFLAYILRIVTVAKWTLAIGPFILRETQRESEDLDWE